MVKLDSIDETEFRLKVKKLVEEKKRDEKIKKTRELIINNIDNIIKNFDCEKSITGNLLSCRVNDRIFSIIKDSYIPKILVSFNEEIKAPIELVKNQLENKDFKLCKIDDKLYACKSDEFIANSHDIINEIENKVNEIYNKNKKIDDIVKIKNEIAKEEGWW